MGDTRTGAGGTAAKAPGAATDVRRSTAPSTSAERSEDGQDVDRCIMPSYSPQRWNDWPKGSLWYWKTWGGRVDPSLPYSCTLCRRERLVRPLVV